MNWCYLIDIWKWVLRGHDEMNDVLLDIFSIHLESGVGECLKPSHTYEIWAKKEKWEGLKISQCSYYKQQIETISF